MAPVLAIIGGSGLTDLEGLKDRRETQISTPFGAPSAPLVYGKVLDQVVVFLARHGPLHTIAPHRINYRANLWALRESGVQNIVAIAAVGGINPAIKLKSLNFPNQLIDYTRSRVNTFFEDDSEPVVHVDFTQPYCESLRQKLIQAARIEKLDAFESGTYAATEGPRLETAAEIDRLERDGCDMVGMTGMPEAVLARELGLCYAACAVCANLAAGRGEGELTLEEIRATLAGGMEKVLMLIRQLVQLI